VQGFTWRGFDEGDYLWIMNYGQSGFGEDFVWMMHKSALVEGCGQQDLNL
jgi:hypothetical protein